MKDIRMGKVHNLAPIILFVYNRIDHTRLTVEALQKNKLAKESILFVISDAPKGRQHADAVMSVRSYIKSIDGFKSVQIFEKEHNEGLAKSIMNGVTQILEDYDKVIVLEDDIVTSRHFLEYMNTALNKYENCSEVWHISGWNYPIEENDSDQSFFHPIMNCWGWGTWKDRWKFFEKDTTSLIKAFSNSQIRRFNAEGAHNFWKQVVDNHSGKLNTWAIFWYSTIFRRNGLCLAPVKSLVTNVGIDGTGMNCGDFNPYGNKINSIPIVIFPTELVVNRIYFDKIKKVLKNLRRFVVIRAWKKFRRMMKK